MKQIVRPLTAGSAVTGVRTGQLVMTGRAGNTSHDECDVAGIDRWLAEFPSVLHCWPGMRVASRAARVGDHA